MDITNVPIVSLLAIGTSHETYNFWKKRKIEYFIAKRRCILNLRLTL